MHLKALTNAHPLHKPLQRFNLCNSHPQFPYSSANRYPLPNGLQSSSALRRRRFGLVAKHGLVVTCCVNSEIDDVKVLETDEEERLVNVEVEVKEGEIGSQKSVWSDLKEIVMFTGPAIGLWLCGPLMSLIDTAVIGQGSSIELAALGPGTVLCDNMSYAFMFLPIATSNLVATSLAKKDKKEVQHQISTLLFVGLVCGIVMMIFTKFGGSWALTAFSGPNNVHIVPAANTYVQIRGLAWPAILVGWVAQSASLGMKDSWGPLKALAVASLVNAVGDIVLCSFLGYGIAGAAWATMVSQVIAGYMMIQTLNSKGYNAFSFSIPSPNELTQIIALSAPVFVTMMAKTAFYSVITYFATSMGTSTVAAHQVMIQLYSMCTVCGEPLSQTAQSFMPELLYGTKRSLLKARNLLKSLLIIGATVGVILGSIGTFIPLVFPKLFTSDPAVMKEMHGVLIPYFLALFITAGCHSVEGTLLAGRELKFLSISMSGCFALGGLVLVLVSSRGYGLPGCWYGLVGFQWARFFLALQRLISSNGILFFFRLGGLQVVQENYIANLAIIKYIIKLLKHRPNGTSTKTSFIKRHPCIRPTAFRKAQDYLTLLVRKKTAYDGKLFTSAQCSYKCTTGYVVNKFVILCKHKRLHCHTCQ